MVLSVEKKKDAIELCIAHTDSIPRFVNVYASKGKKQQLIAKAYLSEGVDNDCFLLQVSEKQLKNDLEINISDAFGNKSAMQSLNLN